jgi:DnaJ-class molecular chaperone
VPHKDYYRTLGVGRHADQAAIKRAYRRRALQYHPDRNKTPRAATRFREAQEAYAVLSDPERRRHYDSTLPSAVRARKSGSRSPAVTTTRLLNVVVEGLGLSLGVSLGSRRAPVSKRGAR